MMKKILVLVCLVLLSTTALSQTRSRTTTKRGTSTSKTSKASASQAAAATAAVKTDGATKVANQIKNLTTFLYLLGGVAKNLEALDAAAKSGQPSPTVERNKATLKASFEDFRVGLDQIEIYFRGKPELEPYYVKLAGSAAGAADAEAQAAAGHFDQAGRKLLLVVNRLTDVLVAMQ
jgi:LAS superfamily LD-carboxypeptidase LdcB